MKRFLSVVMVFGVCVAMAGLVFAQGPGRGGPTKDKGPGAMKDKGPGSYGPKAKESEGKGIGSSVRAAVHSGLRGEELAQFIHNLNAQRGVGKPGGPSGVTPPAYGYGQGEKGKESEAKPEKGGPPKGKGPGAKPEKAGNK